MTEASAHDEQVKDFVRTEMFESGVEQWKLQCINDTSDGVNDPAGQEPVECTGSQRGDNGFDGCQAYPTHGDVDHGRKPFWTVDPDGVNDDTDDRNEPDESQKAVADRIAKDDQTDRSVGACDQNKDHHMVDLFEHFVDMFRDIEGMINGAGSIKQDHADDENGYSCRSKATGCECCFGDQRNGGSHCQDHSDEVGQSAARIFDVKFHVCTSE